jgi:hypothetical protein
MGLSSRTGMLLAVVGLAAGCSASPPKALPSPSAPSSPSASASASGSAGASPQAPECSLFPPANVWHARASGLPVHPDSAAYVASIGAGTPVQAAFGPGTGIQVTTVPPEHPDVPVTFVRSAESDAGPYPLSATTPGGLVVLYDPTRCRLYELSAAHRNPDGTWRADTGAVFDLRSNLLRPTGWASADRAGLPILPGLVRYDEVAAGRIGHPIRITVPRARAGYVWPARHSPATLSDPRLPQLGLRLRLRATVDVTALPTTARVIAEAMQRYGVIAADEGPAWQLCGEPDPRWNAPELAALGRLRGADFEAVDTAALRVTPDSATVRG